jgi:hypothetical protein
VRERQNRIGEASARESRSEMEFLFMKMRRFERELRFMIHM